MPRLSSRIRLWWLTFLSNLQEMMSLDLWLKDKLSQLVSQFFPFHVMAFFCLWLVDYYIIQNRWIHSVAEPILTIGTTECVTWPDNWTTLTADGGVAAQFEHTILITRTGSEILTKCWNYLRYIVKASKRWLYLLRTSWFFCMLHKPIDKLMHLILSWSQLKRDSSRRSMNQTKAGWRLNWTANCFQHTHCG